MRVSDCHDGGWAFRLGCTSPECPFLLHYLHFSFDVYDYLQQDSPATKEKTIMSYFKSEFENKTFSDTCNGKPFADMNYDELHAVEADALQQIRYACMADAMSDVERIECEWYSHLNSARREIRKREAEAAIGKAWAGLFTQIAS
jgi:hypothetical protein